MNVAGQDHNFAKSIIALRTKGDGAAHTLKRLRGRDASQSLRIGYPIESRM